MHLLFAACGLRDVQVRTQNTTGGGLGKTTTTGHGNAADRQNQPRATASNRAADYGEARATRHAAANTKADRPFDDRQTSSHRPTSDDHQAIAGRGRHPGPTQNRADRIHGQKIHIDRTRRA